MIFAGSDRSKRSVQATFVLIYMDLSLNMSPLELADLSDYRTWDRRKFDNAIHTSSYPSVQALK